MKRNEYVKKLILSGFKLDNIRYEVFQKEGFIFGKGFQFVEDMENSQDIIFEKISNEFSNILTKVIVTHTYSKNGQIKKLTSVSYWLFGMKVEPSKEF